MDQFDTPSNNHGIKYMGQIQDLYVPRSMHQSELKELHRVYRVFLFHIVKCHFFSPLVHFEVSKRWIESRIQFRQQHNINKYLCQFCRFDRIITHDLPYIPSDVHRSPSWINFSSRLEWHTLITTTSICFFRWL